MHHHQNPDESSYTVLLIFENRKFHSGSLMHHRKAGGRGMVRTGEGCGSGKPPGVGLA